MENRRDEYQICHILNPDADIKMALFHKLCSSAIPFLLGTIEISYIDELIAEHNERCNDH